jgi:hypothetical protein
MIGILTPFADGDAEALVIRLAAVDVPLVLCPVPGLLAESPFLGIARDKRLGALIAGRGHIGDLDLVDLARTGYAVVAIDVTDPPMGMVAAAFDDAVPIILRSIGWGEPIAVSVAVAAPTSRRT